MKVRGIDPAFYPFLGYTESGKEIRALPWTSESFNEYHRRWNKKDALSANGSFAAFKDNKDIPLKARHYCYLMARTYRAIVAVMNGRPEGRRTAMSIASDAIKRSRRLFPHFYEWWETRPTAQRIPGTFLGM